MVRVVKYCLLIVLVCTSLTVTAADKISVTAMGGPIRDGNGFIQNILISFKVNWAWELSAMALDSSVQNLDNPSKSVPISNLRIISNNSQQEYIMETGNVVEISSGNKKNKEITKRFKIRLLANETDYPGNYAVNLQFRVKKKNKNKNFTDLYSQVFNQPVIQSINILPVTINYNVDPSSNINYIELPQSTRVIVKSNAEWSLSATNNDPIDKITPTIKINNEYMTINNSDLPITRGLPTVVQGMDTLQPQTINVDYKFDLPEGEIIPSNLYPFNIQFKLGEN